jgi:hypothetical protein
MTAHGRRIPHRAKAMPAFKQASGQMGRGSMQT